MTFSEYYYEGMTQDIFFSMTNFSMSAFEAENNTSGNFEGFYGEAKLCLSSIFTKPNLEICVSVNYYLPQTVINHPTTLVTRGLR